ncbi:hypothetical protein [Streptomyces beihaiensis]|uniref:Uncharacterized protein n=1 Tax=Streptomyces beihaiensis TaxID=2984495 RepID=A0ABT3U2M4_9ACTN|nr:hypothetical protein [Streptomyces beihaiensis]MCX3062458.1 hypothetical protein [Streptomyces beihaiensis]
MEPDEGDREPSVEICDDGLRYYADTLRGSPVPSDCPQCLFDLGLTQRASDGSLAPIPPRLAAGAQMDRMRREIEEQRESLATLCESVARAQEIYLGSYGRRDSQVPITARRARRGNGRAGSAA